MTAPLTSYQEQADGGLRRLSPFYWIGNLRLVVKLPLIIGMLGTLVALVLTVTAFIDARSIMIDEIENKFELTLASRTIEVERELKAIEEDLLAQAISPNTVSALNSFSLAWRTIGEGQTATLQRDYVQTNPHPAGQRDALISTGAGGQYDMVHTKYHPYFRRLMQARGYYDIFLIDAKGNVVYSTFKEADFATNLDSGRWRDTDLANAYRDAMKAQPGETMFYDFTEYAPSGGAASFIATPILRGTETAGVLVFQMPLEHLNEIANNSYGLGETGEVMIVGEDFRRRTKSRFEGRGGVLAPVKQEQYLTDAFRDSKPQFLEHISPEGHADHIMAAGVHFKGVHWAIVVEQGDDELMAPVTDLRNLLAMQVSGLIAVVALIGWLIGRGVSKPFTAVGMALNNVASGDLTTRIPGTHRKEDAGDLARNLEQLREKLSLAEDERRANEHRSMEQKVVVETLTQSITELAQGNLTAKITREFAADYEDLRAAYNGAVGRLNDTISSLLGAAQEIDSNAREVENASNDLSQKAIEQAASLEETAAAITQLSASVKTTADSASDADQVMNRAKSDAESSGEVVGRAMTAMDKISTSSQKITQVTSVIEDLAFQTNLLALNAGVEAARAGEAGRGFAVVASEVRALAQRSSDAAKEINTLIHESAENVVNGVDLVEKAGASFESLIGDFEKVSKSVSAIALAAREQSVGLDEINTAVDQLDGVTQKNAAVATQVHGTGKAMVNEANRLMQVSTSFRVDPNTASAPAAVAAAPARQVAAKAVVNAPVASLGDVSDDEWSEF
jgi:methyl-accepting chemotaxis protein